MAPGPQLRCPLCQTVVADGTEPTPGACAGCGAGYAGGGDDPRSGVAAAIAWWGLTGLNADLVSGGLFQILPTDPFSRVVTVTSDRRDGFYRWWVFVAADTEPAVALARAATYAS